MDAGSLTGGDPAHSDSGIQNIVIPPDDDNNTTTQQQRRENEEDEREGAAAVRAPLPGADANAHLPPLAPPPHGESSPPPPPDPTTAAGANKQRLPVDDTMAPIASASSSNSSPLRHPEKTAAFPAQPTQQLQEQLEPRRSSSDGGTTTAATATPQPAAAPAAKPAPPPAAAATENDENSPRCDCILKWLGVIDRQGTFATAWAALLTVNVVASVCFLVPFRIGFYLRNWEVWIGPDIFCDVVFLLNIFVNLRTSFEQDGEEVRDPRKIEDAYLGWPLARDIFGILPLEMISLGLPDGYEPGLRANRLVFTVLLPDLFERWERLTTIKPSIIRIWKSIFVVFFCTHVMGCIFHLISMLEGDDALDSFTGTTDLNRQDLTARYFRSVFWSFVTMTGYNNTNPNTLPEAVFSFFVTLMGISLFATIIGSVGSLVTNLDSSKLYFRQKLDSINEYMSYKKIPENLQDDVRNYFLYLWKSGKGLDKNQALDQLPQYLKHKMNMFLNKSVITSVPLFEQWKHDNNFITEIVKNLTSRIYLPNTVVVSEGDIGNEMFFVSHGELNVIINGNQVINTFRDGNFFGEIAILLDMKRTATIVARTYCDMSILTKDAFRKVLRRFPDVAEVIKKMAEDRMAKLQEKSHGATMSPKDTAGLKGVAAAAAAALQKEKQKQQEQQQIQQQQQQHQQGGGAASNTASESAKGVSAQSVFSNTSNGKDTDTNGNPLAGRPSPGAAGDDDDDEEEMIERRNT